MRRGAPSAIRPTQPDFYATAYGPGPAAVHRDGPVDLRRPGRTSVVIIPERLDNGALSPCAYIRLLQPLDHPACSSAVAGVDSNAAQRMICS